jgi:CYTH domain-containing protein
MAIEIERKYLVDPDKWNKAEKGVKHFYRQGYILTDPEKTIRVRITDESGFITIKGKSVGASRPEYEYPIPKQDAIELLDRFCSSDVSKFRYVVPFAGKVWEVDEFLAANKGLLVAEIELTSEDEIFETPEWIDKEVTGIEKYYNSNLSKYPFKYWS